MKALLLFTLALALGCSDPEPETPDTGITVPKDAAAPDMGTAPEDSGTTGGEDAAPGTDAAPMNEDSGTADEDAGEAMDSGEAPLDSGVPETDAGMAMGACTNPADETVHTNSDVPALVEDCAGGCFGAPNCTRMCLINDVGLSMPCAECYVEATSCAIQNCLTECAGMDSAACEMCRDASGCTDAFRTCSGFAG